MRINRASLSKTAPKLTFLNTGNIIIVLTPNDEELINNLFTDSFLNVTSDDISNGRGFQFWMRVRKRKGWLSSSCNGGIQCFKRTDFILYTRLFM